MADKKLSLDEAMALLDKHALEDAQKLETLPKPTGKSAKKKKVKDAIKTGAKQGRGGLNLHARDLLDQIED
jgi:hypothetical protein